MLRERTTDTQLCVPIKSKIPFQKRRKSLDTPFDRRAAGACPPSPIFAREIVLFFTRLTIYPFTAASNLSGVAKLDGRSALLNPERLTAAVTDLSLPIFPVFLLISFVRLSPSAKISTCRPFCPSIAKRQTQSSVPAKISLSFSLCPSLLILLLLFLFLSLSFYVLSRETKRAKEGVDKRLVFLDVSSGFKSVVRPGTTLREKREPVVRKRCFFLSAFAVFTSQHKVTNAQTSSRDLIRKPERVASGDVRRREAARPLVSSL